MAIKFEFTLPEDQAELILDIVYHEALRLKEEAKNHKEHWREALNKSADLILAISKRWI